MVGGAKMGGGCQNWGGGARMGGGTVRIRDIFCSVGMGFI